MVDRWILWKIKLVFVYIIKGSWRNISAVQKFKVISSQEVLWIIVKNHYIPYKIVYNIFNVDIIPSI